MLTGHENKMLAAEGRENKQDTPEDRGYRVPLGKVDAEGRVRIIHDGPVPLLDIRTFRRSPADVSADAFRPTIAAFTLELQYADELIEAIQKARAA
jgi:hypothetical protein